MIHNQRDNLSINSRRRRFSQKVRLLSTAALLALGILLFPSPPGSTAYAATKDTAAEQQIVYTTARLNVRTGPSTDYKRLTTLPYGTELTVIDTCDNGWLLITYNDSEAYVSGKYTIETRPEAKATVTTVAAVPGIAESRNGASDAWVSKINARLAFVPENIKARFVAEGWHIYATTENIAQTYYPGVYGSVQGMTHFDEKYILIETRDSAVTGATVHEMGHFLDYILGFPSDSSEFAQIYAEEAELFKSRISNPGCVRDTGEFFAETLEYLLARDASKCTPKARAFVEARINMV